MRLFLILLILNIQITSIDRRAFCEAKQVEADHQADSSDDSTFSEHLGKMDIPDRFALKEITIGKDDAKTHLIIYSSFTCPYCREFHRKEFPKFKTKYVDTGMVKVSFRCYIDDQGALDAAQITRCLSNESTDKYMSLYNEVYEQQSKWLKEKNPAEFLKSIFLKLGFDKKNIDACLKRTDIAAGLMLEQKNAMHKLQVLSIPAFLANGNMHLGKIKYDELVFLCGLAD